MLALAAAFVLSSGAFAQGCCKKKEGANASDNTDMAKKRTEKMAERYGLNDEQKAKVLQINTEFFAKYGKKQGCCKDKGEQKSCDGKSGATASSCNKGKTGDAKEAKKCDKRVGDTCAKDGKKCDKAQGGCQNKCDNEKSKEQVKADVAKYKADLKKVLTKEQYEKYENDIKERCAKCPSHKK